MQPLPETFRHRLAILLILVACCATWTGAAAAADADDVTVASGSTWDRRTAKIQGEWRIVERDGGLVLVLGDDFKTKRAPDLKAFLVPVAPAAVGSSEIPTGSVRIGLLDRHKGAQELALPDGVTLGDFQALAIHCERFSKVWGVTALP